MLNANRLEDKAKLLTQLSELIQAKRKLSTANSLSLFISSYLNSLLTNRTPLFHTEIIGLLQQSILNKTKGVGDTIPLPPPTNLQITPTHFPTIFRNEDENKLLNRILFIAPRGFAKSTICSVMFPLWLAVFGARKDIFIVSATMSLARELLRKIRVELETNEKLLQDFGDLKSDKWTEDFLMLKNGVAIRAKGRGFQIRGFRPDQIICDDLEDEEVIYSKEQREKLEVWFNRTLLPSLKPNQNLVYIGTKLHEFSLISKIEKKPEFLKRKYQAITNGVSIWEDLWSLETLKKLRTEIGTYAFESEYQNNPISLADSPIKFHFLDDVHIKGEKELSCLAIDPAVSERTTSDFRAFVLFARTPEGFREVFSEQGRWSVTEQIEKIIGIYERYKPDRVVIEEVAFQKVYKDLLIKESRARKIFIPVQTADLGVGEKKTPRDKLTRLMAVVHLFEQRLVEVVNPELKQELLTFPFGENDDLVDATVYALGWLMRSRKDLVAYKKEDKTLPIKTKQAFHLEEIRPGVYAAKLGEPLMKQKRGFINMDK